MGMMINRRRAMGGKSLPYDAEIDYLRSTGTQYIDSGIEVDSHLSVGFSVKTSNYINAAYCGAIQMSPIVRHHGNASGIVYMYNTLPEALSLPVNTWGYFTLDTDNRLATLNGVSVSFNVQEWSINANYGIFGRLADTGQIQTVNAKVDFASFKLWRNNKTLRDFIPVRVGTTGYLYDKVSGQLFGNQGTGDFILGLDTNMNDNITYISTFSTYQEPTLAIKTGKQREIILYYSGTPWTNGFINIEYIRGYGWRVTAVTKCVCDGIIYNEGDSIAEWRMTETKILYIESIGYSDI